MVSYASWDAEAGGRLDKALRSLGDRKTQATIAAKTPETLRSYVRAASPPPMELIERVAAAANVSPGWILTGQGPMRPEIVRQPLTDAMVAEVQAALDRTPDADVLRLCGVARPAVQAQLDERMISPGFVLALLQFTGVSLSSALATAAPLQPLPVAPPPTRYGPVPVVILRGPPMSKWYNPEVLTIQTPRPDALLAPDAFAVEVPDDTLSSVGCRAGVKLFCDPALEPQQYDIVYVELLKKGKCVGGLRYVEGVFRDPTGRTTLDLVRWLSTSPERATVHDLLRLDELSRIAVVALIRTRP